MIRFLILLFTLNALFPTAGFACVCASKMKMSSSTMSVSMSENEGVPSRLMEQSTASLQMHCDHSINMEMSCDSGCCANCLGVSAVLTGSSVSVLPLLILSTKPVSGYINFYTRSISPELQPPLI